ncbi:MAG: hypothetical protein K0B07_03875 [DPANN group archaeon]|nr:hypothetical protein [DPANN group archaeon]
MSDTANADILLEIKKVEKKASQLEKDASEKQEKTLAKARQMATSWIDDAKEEAEETSKQMLDDAKRLILEKRENAFNISNKETSAFVKKSEKNIKKATDYIISEFLNTINKNNA